MTTTTMTTTSNTGSETTTAITGGSTPEGGDGDVNIDGSRSMLDIVYLNKYIAGIIQLNEQQIIHADTFKDSEINAKDSTALMKLLAGQIKVLPVLPND